jgi:hypothetical protein
MLLIYVASCSILMSIGFIYLTTFDFECTQRIDGCLKYSFYILLAVIFNIIIYIILVTFGSCSLYSEWIDIYFKF